MFAPTTWQIFDDLSDFFYKTEIPYVPFYSFAEMVLSVQPEVSRNRELYSAYSEIANRIITLGEKKYSLRGIGFPDVSSTVFIAHAAEDKETALRLYKDLQKVGLVPWLDIEDLLPGQNWQSVTTKMIEQTDYALVLLSSKSIAKPGYFQKELRHILERYAATPKDSIFLIPIRLDECDIPEIIRDINSVNLFSDYEMGLEKTIDAIKYSETKKGWKAH